jgi:hypothetical protein
MMHDLALFVCGVAFAYVSDHYLFARHMRKHNARMRRLSR